MESSLPPLPAMYSTPHVMFKERREENDLFWDKLSPEIGVVGIYGPVTFSVGMLGKGKLNKKTVCTVSHWQALSSIQMSPGGTINVYKRYSISCS